MSDDALGAAQNVGGGMAPCLLRSTDADDEVAAQVSQASAQVSNCLELELRLCAPDARRPALAGLCPVSLSAEHHLDSDIMCQH